MTIIIERDRGLQRRSEEQFGLECPYCGVYSHMSLQSVPNFDRLHADRPRYVGLVYQCDACRKPIFLRYSVKKFTADGIELKQNFMELDRPKERFAFSYLPRETEVLFREALSCYSSNNFNAFASMCRRAANRAFAELGENGKLRAFDEVMVAQNIADIDDSVFEPIKKVLFDNGKDEDLPLLGRAQAGILLEVMKDMLYQCFVRRGKLTRALKVRKIFVQEDDTGLRTSA